MARLDLESLVLRLAVEMRQQTNELIASRKAFVAMGKEIAALQRVIQDKMTATPQARKDFGLPLPKDHGQQGRRRDDRKKSQRASAEG